METAQTFEEFIAPYYENVPIFSDELADEIKASFGHPRKWRKLTSKYADHIYGSSLDDMRPVYYLMQTGEIPTSKSIPIDKYNELYKQWETNND